MDKNSSFHLTFTSIKNKVKQTKNENKQYKYNYTIYNNKTNTFSNSPVVLASLFLKRLFSQKKRNSKRLKYLKYRNILKVERLCYERANQKLFFFYNRIKPNDREDENYK
jgi:hypothetical protein